MYGCLLYIHVYVNACYIIIVCLSFLPCTRADAIYLALSATCTCCWPRIWVLWVWHVLICRLSTYNPWLKHQGLASVWSSFGSVDDRLCTLYICWRPCTICVIYYSATGDVVSFSFNTQCCISNWHLQLFDTLYQTRNSFQFSKVDHAWYICYKRK